MDGMVKKNNRIGINIATICHCSSVTVFESTNQNNELSVVRRNWKKNRKFEKIIYIHFHIKIFETKKQ